MMKQRFGGMLGGVLSIALGATLIAGGTLSGTDGAAGTPPPTCQAEVVGTPVPCPTGTITVTESEASPGARSAARARAAATPPQSWSVLVTSTNCTAPNGTAVSQTLVVPTGGSATTDPLFLFTDPGHATSCSYQLAATPVAGFTSKFSPTPPVTIPLSQNREAANNVTVQLINTAIAPVTPPASPSASSSASSASASVSESASVSNEASSAGPSSSAAPIAATGPAAPAGWTLALGIALCLFGAVLLVAGRPERWRGRRVR